MSKLILGTVQFGLDYGIKNAKGRVTEEEVTRILASASEGGIDTLDTAAAYGESESVLGRVLGSSGRFKIISKLRAGFTGSSHDELYGSLEKLKIPRLHAFMLHSFDIYRANPTILAELAECSACGLVEKLGSSLYHPEEAMALLDAHEPVDIVQVPYSLLDRRFETVFPLLKERGIEIHVRSVFLQGALLMDHRELPPFFSPIREKLEALKRLAEESGVPVATLCLAFAANNPNVDGVVMGVDGVDNLATNIAAFEARRTAVIPLANLIDIRTDNEDIILPYRWKK